MDNETPRQEMQASANEQAKPIETDVPAIPVNGEDSANEDEASFILGYN
jgi:hypothetical protein